MTPRAGNRTLGLHSIDPHNRTTRNGDQAYEYDAEGNRVRESYAANKIVFLEFNATPFEENPSTVTLRLGTETIVLSSDETDADALIDSLLDAAGFGADATSVSEVAGGFLIEFIHGAARQDIDLEIDSVMYCEPNLITVQNFWEKTYEWDFRNRLAAVESADGETSPGRVEYKYDAFDRLIGRVESETTETRFVYDGNQIVARFGGDYGDPLAPTKRYLWGPEVDQLLAQETFDATNNEVDALAWQLTDHQNTVRDLLDAGGELIAHFAFDSFGNLLSAVDGSNDPLADVSEVTDYLYTGRWFDFTVSLQYNDHRWYDPQLGKWISEDPIGFNGGLMNLSNYVGNDPWNNTDPTGLSAAELAATRYATATPTSSVSAAGHLASLGANAAENILAPLFTKGIPGALGLGDSGVASAAMKYQQLTGKGLSPLNPACVAPTSPSTISRAWELFRRTVNNAALPRNHADAPRLDVEGMLRFAWNSYLQLQRDTLVLPDGRWERALFPKNECEAHQAQEEFGRTWTIFLEILVAELGFGGPPRPARPQAGTAGTTSGPTSAPTTRGAPTNLGPVGSKAPRQVTPGVRELEGHYIDDLGRSQPWRAHYDEYGRLIGRTDYNAGNKAASIPDTHYERWEYSAEFPLGRKVENHVPGEFPL